MVLEELDVGNIYILSLFSFANIEFFVDFFFWQKYENSSRETLFL